MSSYTRYAPKYVPKKYVAGKTFVIPTARKLKIPKKGTKVVRKANYGIKPTGPVRYNVPAPKFKYRKANPKKSWLGQFNDKIMDIGNGVMTNMVTSIPGISSIFGSGDYKIKSNTSMKGLTDGVPQFGGSRGSRVTRVRHREYIGDVISGAANSFNIQNYTINPGLDATFPWLSGTAQNYEEYKIKGMVFEFKSMSADALNSTNTALGQVIMATQYNVLSKPFTTKQQMENYEFATSVKPSCSAMHPIECEPHETPLTELFVRNNANATVATSDNRFYDFGIFSIATNGMQGTNVNLGELWVTFDIQLFKPRLGATQLFGDHWQLPGGLGVSGNLYLQTSGSGVLATKTSSSNFDTTVTNNTLTIPSWYSGAVQIIYAVYGTSAATSAVTWTPDSRGVVNNIYGGDASNNLSPGNAGTPIYVQNITFIVTAGCTFTLSGGSLPSAVVQGDLIVLASPIIN